MSRIHFTTVVALATMVLPAAPAFAQTTFNNNNVSPTATEGRVGDHAMCQGAAGGSRMRQNCEQPQTTTVRAEAQLRRAVAAPSAPQCEATTLTEYSQRNSVARVTGTISLANCPAGTTGTYNIVARVKDETGEIKPIEFSEIWQNDAAQDVPFTADYPIGDNVELVNVRVRNLKCTCVGATETVLTESAESESSAPEAAPPN
jgi:hypothetical protein